MIVQPLPTDAELLAVALQWHAAVRNYYQSLGYSISNVEKQSGGRRDSSRSGQPEASQTDPNQSANSGQQPVDFDDIWSAVETGGAIAITGGLAALASLLMLQTAGVSRRDAFDAGSDLLRGHVPEDPFEAWKRKYEALGWKYSEKNGVATFDPVDGARNEGGEIYSAERGGFVRPVERDAGRPAAAAARRRRQRARRGVEFDSPAAMSSARPTTRTWRAGRRSPRRTQSDLADMQRPDEDVAELQRKIAATRRRARRCAPTSRRATNCWARSASSAAARASMRLLDESRSGLFDELSDRLLTTPADNDYRKGLEGPAAAGRRDRQPDAAGLHPDLHLQGRRAGHPAAERGGGARCDPDKGLGQFGGRQRAGDARRGPRRRRRARHRDRGGQGGGDRRPVRQGDPLRRRLCRRGLARRQERGRRRRRERRRSAGAGEPALQGRHRPGREDAQESDDAGPGRPCRRLRPAARLADRRAGGAEEPASGARAEAKRIGIDPGGLQQHAAQRGLQAARPDAAGEAAAIEPGTGRQEAGGARLPHPGQDGQSDQHRPRLPGADAGQQGQMGRGAQDKMGAAFQRRLCGTDLLRQDKMP